jgi:FkbM family methyltransferase
MGGVRDRLAHLDPWARLGGLEKQFRTAHLELIGPRLEGVERRMRGLDKRMARLRHVERYETAHVRAGRLDYEHAEIFMRLGSFPEFQRLRSCHSEPWTVQWIEDWVQPGEVLYDIGANVGAYTLVAALSPRSRATVFAFEPMAVNYAALTENVILNGAADRVTPLPVALAESTRLETLHLRILDAGGARHILGTDDPAADAMYPQPALTFSLDELAEHMRLPSPAHIKIDVDGSEVAVLRGAARTLADPTLRSVLCELDHDAADTIVELLTGAGFELRERFQREKAGPVQPPAQALFARG